MKSSSDATPSPDHYLTVKELQEKLAELVEDNPDIANYTVYSEGCDCTEEAMRVGVHHDIDRGWIEIERAPYDERKAIDSYVVED